MEGQRTGAVRRDAPYVLHRQNVFATEDGRSIVFRSLNGWNDLDAMRLVRGVEPVVADDGEGCLLYTSDAADE